MRIRFTRRKNGMIRTLDINANAAKSFTDLWQRYSPTAWNEMYNEYSKYTIRMTELYQEYAKSS